MTEEFDERTVSLHNAQELDNNLGAWVYEDLAFAGFFSVIDGIERIIQNAGLNHNCGIVAGGKLWIAQSLEAKDNGR